MFADSCKLTWDEPEDDGGAKLTGYIVEKCEDNSGIWEPVPVLGDNKEAQIKNLTPGHKYQFRIKAENPYGASLPSETNKGIIAKNPYDPPDEPRDIKITKFDKTFVSLSWKPPASDGGNPIKGYKIEKRIKNRKGGSDWQACNFEKPIKETHFTVLNLSEGSTMEFRVSAINDAGAGKPSSTTGEHVVRDPVFEAGSPSQPKVSEISPNSMKISWEKPRDDGGGRITSYIVEVKEEDDDSPNAWKEASTSPVRDLSATIPNLKEGKKYQFRVRAINSAGPGQASKPSVGVKAEKQPEKPVLNMRGVKDITINAGKDLRVNIPIKGCPIPKARWARNGEGINESDKDVTIKVTEDMATLIISNSKRKHTGEYNLSLTNPSGTANGSLNVTILDVPANPEGPLTATNINATSIGLSWKAPKDNGGCKVERYIVEKRPKGSSKWSKVPGVFKDNQAVAKNLDEGTEYEFRVSALNENGTSEPLECEAAIVAKHPFDPPGSPVSPECIATTEDSITLKWERPTKDGGRPISGYVIEKKDPTTSRWMKAHIGEITGQQATIKGLVQGRPYEFRVAAINEAGKSKWAECDSAITPAPEPSLPRAFIDPLAHDVHAAVGEPFRVRISYHGHPKPQITWENKGNPVKLDGKRLHVEVGEEDIILICKSAEKEDSGKYTATLSNIKGVDIVHFNVYIRGKPGAPSGPLEVSDVTPESCILHWQNPEDDGGSAVSNYIVEKREKGSNSWSPVSRFVRGNKCGVNDLEPNKEYEFRVTAVNENGPGDEHLETDKPIKATHNFSTPDQPSRLRVIDTDKDSVRLSWDKPRSDGGDRIKGYIVEMKPKGSSRWMPVNEKSPCKGTNYQVENLEKNSEYEFRVRAKNSAGAGEPSNSTGTVEIQPKATKAPPPTSLNIESSGRNGAQLTWTKPRVDDRLKGYNIERKKPGSDGWERVNTLPVVDNSFSILDLPKSQPYEYRVAAVNDAGEGNFSLPTAPFTLSNNKRLSAPEFKKTLCNVTAPSGGNGKFEVQFAGEPEDIKWYRDGIEIRPGAYAKISRDGDKATLTLSNLTPTDRGDVCNPIL